MRISLRFVKLMPLYIEARGLLKPALNPKRIQKRVSNRFTIYTCRLQQARNGGYFAVRLSGKAGFFAQLTWCLRILTHCERHGLIPIIILSNPWYTRPKDTNWLEYFFEFHTLKDADREAIEKGCVKVSSVEEIRQLGLPDYMSHMNLEQANRLFNKYFRLKVDIQEYVDNFARLYFGNKSILGVHYRGTDKNLEAEPVSREACITAVHAHLRAHPDIRSLFVASDEDLFVTEIKAAFRPMEVIAHDDQERSNNNRPTYNALDRGDNYIKGKEALVNCLLLSRCNALVRTASALSGWASVFNPDLKIILLNRPFDHCRWFPDSEIIKRIEK